MKNANTKKLNIYRIYGNYDVSQKCDKEDICILMPLQKENNGLKKQVKELKKKLADTKHEMYI